MLRSLWYIRLSRPLSETCSSLRHKHVRLVSTGHINSPGDAERFIDFHSRHHISPSWLQHGLLALASGVTCILDPSRDDMIATFGETTGHFALQHMRQSMEESETGRQILRDQPRITTTTVDIPWLKTLEQNTFGRAYGDFLDRYGFSPDARKPVQFISDPELAYVMQRYRECHDLLHTLLGMPTNMLGEVAVKWIEAAQFTLPMCRLAALVGPVRLGPRHTQKYIELVLPWVQQVVAQARPLLSVYYEKEWEKPLTDLRAELCIPPPPVL